MVGDIIIFQLALCIVTGLMFIAIHYADKDNRLTFEVKFVSEIVLTVVLVMSVLTISFVLLNYTFKDKEPTAQDVIDGKCILGYTVVDGEVVDSCYVWKDK